MLLHSLSSIKVNCQVVGGPGALARPIIKERHKATGIRQAGLRDDQRQDFAACDDTIACLGPSNLAGRGRPALHQQRWVV